MAKKTISTKLAQQFYSSLSRLSNPEQMEVFFELFFSKTERENYLKRFETLHFLAAGKSYTEIQKELGVSSASIAHTKKIAKDPLISHILKLSNSAAWAKKTTKKLSTLLTPKS